MSLKKNIYSHSGLTYEEHQKAIDINVFDRYVVFEVNGKGVVRREEKEASNV